MPDVWLMFSATAWVFIATIHPAASCWPPADLFWGGGATWVWSGKDRMFDLAMNVSICWLVVNNLVRFEYVELGYVCVARQENWKTSYFSVCQYGNNLKLWSTQFKLERGIYLIIFIFLSSSVDLSLWWFGDGLDMNTLESVSRCIEDKNC